MNPVIAQHRAELERLCRRYRVSRLELFGSAAAGRQKRGESDLDFLVEFDPLAPGDYANT
jgi:predicted nucleotidyltransferase